MKWAYSIRHKLKAAFVLTVIMVVILLSNVSEQRSFSSLDTSMTSINNDRLKPAAYLYEISNNLYQKRLMHEDKDNYSQTELKSGLAKHNQAIVSLIAAYDKTLLTAEESRQWAHFKQNLRRYNAVESSWLQSYIAGTIPISSEAALVQAFDKTISNLNQLNRIQVGEGDNLQKNSHSIISNTLMLSYLEISLLIVLGLFTLVILSTTDQTIFRKAGNEALN